MQNRLQEVKEPNVGVLVRVKQVHVIDRFEVFILTSEVELLADKQNYNIAQFI